MTKLYAVDDDRMFLDVVESVASPMGFDVVKVAQSRRFRTVYRGEPDAIVIIDMIMPDLDGIELMSWMMSGNPPGAVIFVSGFSDRYPALAGELARHKGLKRVETLTKPVRIAQLRAALDGARAAIAADRVQG